MAMLMNLLGGALSLVALVCWILVLIEMFKRGATTPAILSIVLIICGIGPLIAFVYGWMRQRMGHSQHHVDLDDLPAGRYHLQRRCGPHGIAGGLIVRRTC